jgi:hypothetical protein
MEYRSTKFNYLYLPKKRSWKTIEFPSKIKLIENPDEVLPFFNQAFKYFKKKNNVEFDLSNINHFSPESLAFFTACVADKRFTNNMSSKGNLPKSKILTKLFLESGFFDHVFLGNGSIKPKSSENNKLIHNETNNKVETGIASDICSFVMDKIGFIYEDEMEPLYVTLIEAMQNTNNHASANTKDSYNWWLYSFEDRQNDLLHFTFLDIGVGVFNSLSVRNWRTKLMEAAKFTSNLSLVDDLINGKIRSRTKRTDRGKGIPQIYDSSLDPIFEDFYILSNDILMNTKSNKRLLLQEEFHGTMYYWTIKTKNNGN